jgi:hypothetical protein
VLLEIKAFGFLPVQLTNTFLTTVTFYPLSSQTLFYNCNFLPVQLTNTFATTVIFYLCNRRPGLLRVGHQLRRLRGEPVFRSRKLLAHCITLFSISKMFFFLSKNYLPPRRNSISRPITLQTEAIPLDHSNRTMCYEYCEVELVTFLPGS